MARRRYRALAANDRQPLPAVVEPPEAGSHGKPARAALVARGYGPGDHTMIDRTLARSARVYDHVLNGTEHFAVDRHAAESHAQALGGIDNLRNALLASRHFIRSAVRYLAGEAGVLQFLDLGSGLPHGSDNVHDVARAISPEARTVYIDNDPVVLAHARGFGHGHPDGTTAYVHADLRDVNAVLAVAEATLDLAQPVAVVFASTLQFIADDDHPHKIVRRYLDAVGPGSYLAVTHLAADIHAETTSTLAQTTTAADTIGYTFHPRTRDELAQLFDDLDLVGPGIVPTDQWQPNKEARPRTDDVTSLFHACVGRTR